MTYDPKKHLMLIKGKEYLPVKERLIWWREEHPNGSVSTEIVHADYERNYYVCKATVSWTDEAGHTISATGHKSESVKDFGEPMEKAETGAIGRALAMLGYGTQFAHELDEGARIVDSPVDARPAPHTQRQSPAKPTVAQSDGDQRSAAIVAQQKQAAARGDRPGRPDRTASDEELLTRGNSLLAADTGAQQALAARKTSLEVLNSETLAATVTWLTDRATKSLHLEATTAQNGGA